MKPIKDTFKKWLILLFPYILIFTMMVSQIMLWQGMQSAKKELELLKKQKGKEETIFNINRPLSDIENRESSLYPKLDRNIENINKRIQELNKQIYKEEKNKPIKEKYYEKFKDKNFNEINEYFNSILSNPSNNSDSGNK